MRPRDLKTRIFLDGGDHGETKEIIKILGFLDGQTTNPTLISKNPLARQRPERGERFTREEILDFYEHVVRDISSLIPQGFKEIPYKDIDLNKNWQEYDITHELTVKGMERFSADWNALIK